MRVRSLIQRTGLRVEEAFENRGVERSATGIRSGGSKSLDHRNEIGRVLAQASGISFLRFRALCQFALAQMFKL